MYNTYALGHDGGNADLCDVAFINGRMQVIKMPSALYKGSYEDLLSSLKAASAESTLSRVLTDTAHTISVNGEQWFAGDLAIKQASAKVPLEALTARKDIARYWTTRNLALLLTGAGTLIKDVEFGLFVVANLPIETYSEQNAKNVRAALNGTHIFTLDGIRRTVHVNVQKVIMEGAGAYIAHKLEGNPNAAVIDIGGNTTDVYMAKGMIPVTGRCKTEEIGVETGAELVASRFEQIYHYPITPADTKALLYQYKNGKNYLSIPTVINAEANVTDIHDLITNVLREVGARIKEFVKRTWASSLTSDVTASDITDVLLVGGGAYYFEEDLKPLFKRRLRKPENPEYANATGYAKLAQNYLSQRTSATV